MSALHLLHPAQVADFLGVSEWWVREKARTGAAHVRLAKRQIRFTEAQVMALVAGCVVAEPKVIPAPPQDGRTRRSRHHARRS